MQSYQKMKQSTSINNKDFYNILESHDKSENNLALMKWINENTTFHLILKGKGVRPSCTKKRHKLGIETYHKDGINMTIKMDMIYHVNIKDVERHIYIKKTMYSQSKNKIYQMLS